MRNELRNLILGSMFVAVALAGCSDARSGGRPEAERVFVADAGDTWLLVRDGNGVAIGGNCFRE